MLTSPAVTIASFLFMIFLVLINFCHFNFLSPSLSPSLSLQLELAVKSWNTNTTLIGGIFTQYPSYWEMYIEYAQSYTVAMK